MRSFAPDWDVEDPRQALRARDEGVRWFLSFGLRLDELGVRLDRSLAESSEPNVRVGGEPRLMEFTLQSKIQEVGMVGVSFNPLNNISRIFASLEEDGIKLFGSSAIEGINVQPRSKHTEMLGLQFKDPSPFKTNFVQLARMKYYLQSKNFRTKATVRHKAFSASASYNNAEGPSAQLSYHVRRKQLLSFTTREKQWRLSWKAIDTDEPFFITFELPSKGHWEDRLDDAILTVKKRFIIDGMRLFEEMTKMQF